MLNSYAGISPLVAASASGRFLEVLQPRMIAQRFGQPEETLGKNSGHIIKWRRYHRPDSTRTPLAEGVTPAGNRIRYTDYQATMQEFGDFVEITDVIQDLHTDPVLQRYTDLNAQEAAITVELQTIDMLNSGSNVYYAGNVAARTSVATPPSRNDLRRIIRDFDANNVREITDMIAATSKISTAGVLPAFVAMGHTNLDADIRGIQGFRDISEYGSSDEIMPDSGEIGKVERVRFCLTSLFTPVEAAGAATTNMLSSGAAPATATACDVYRLIIVGKDAYGVVRLQGIGKAKVYVVPVDKADKSDPIAQRGSVGWKLYYACAILDEQRIARLECACSVLN